MRHKGKITHWNDDKGFGFITPIGGRKKIFIHIKSFKNRHNLPSINQSVTYTVSVDKQGRQCATDASRVDDVLYQASKNKIKMNPIYIIVVVVFFIFLSILVLNASIPSNILLIYALLSLITFSIYAWDKSAAENDTWRTSENTLHLCSIAGGWPGALMAQQKFRHKSNKQPFKTIFFITALMNVGLLLPLYATL